jgi:hypothetical protein
MPLDECWCRDERDNRVPPESSLTRKHTAVPREGRRTHTDRRTEPTTRVQR